MEKHKILHLLFMLNIFQMFKFQISFKILKELDLKGNLKFLKDLEGNLKFENPRIFHFFQKN